MRALLPLLPLIWLLILGGGLALALVFRDYLPWIVGGGVLLLAGLWVLGCTFSPATPDRTCPECGDAEGLVRLEKGKMLGVRCTRCGHEDENLYRAYLDEV